MLQRRDAIFGEPKTHSRASTNTAFLELQQ